MLVVLVMSALFGGALSQLEVVNQWNLLQFDIPFNYPNSNFQPERSVFTGVEVGWDRIFLATPRIWSGNPATLSFIPRSKPGQPNPQSPPLRAYPSWDWHVEAASGNVQNGNCTGLISVFRVRADRCNRLWVLDSGVLDSLVTFTVACPPRLLVFDMRTDRLIRQITLPQEVVRRNTLLTNLVLDDQNTGSGPLNAYNNCDNMFVYMSDTTSPAIIVYDAKRDTTWRLQQPFFFPDPDFGTYKLGGEQFTLMDGIIGLALSPPGHSGRTLYFQPFASERLYSIPTSALQRGPNPGDDAELPVTLVGHKSSQAAGLTVDPRDGSVIFCPISETAIAAWQPGSSNHRVVAYDPELLQFALDFVSADRDSGTIWVATTKFQKIWLQTINPNEMNLRIMRIVEPNHYFNNSLLLYKKK